MPEDALSTVAVTTMFALAMVELHVELVAGAASWLAAWWLLREQTARPVGPTEQSGGHGA